MANNSSKRPKILFLFSDTGGGHRSATEAIIEALQLEYGDAVETEMVDFFKYYAPGPFKQLPSWYPYMVRLPQMWALGYRLSNGRRRTRLMTGSIWLYVRDAIRKLVADHPSDLIVALHPLILDPLMRALGDDRRPPFITVVTDLATTHAFWYHIKTDLCIVPTEEAFRRALKNKLSPEKVKVIGLPVANRFCQPVGDPAALRRQLGWPVDLPMVVLVGGGEGMGPLAEIAEALAQSGLKIGLAVVAGRNDKLKAKLEGREWPIPTFIYGFVRNMPDFMGAANVLLTKAGPGTVTEALNAGLPMILYSRLPGQEDGNVSFITDAGAGVWAPTTAEIVKALSNWIRNPEKRQEAAKICRSLAKPQAAREIAHILAERAGLKA